MNIAYNMDCMIALREMPDNAFDLAVVDPPYGSGLDPEISGGGSTGNDSEADSINTARPLIHRGGVARQTEILPRFTISERTAESRTERGVTRTGGTWAGKYAKKLLRGTQRREKIISKNFSVSHETRSSGAATISDFHPPAVSLCGAS